MQVAKGTAGAAEGKGEGDVESGARCCSPCVVPLSAWPPGCQSRVYSLFLGMAKWSPDRGRLKGSVLPGPSMGCGASWKAMDRADSSALHTHLLQTRQD